MSARVVELLDRGLGHYAIGEVEQAIACWRDVLVEEPENAQAREYLGLVGATGSPREEQPQVEPAPPAPWRSPAGGAGRGQPEGPAGSTEPAAGSPPPGIVALPGSAVPSPALWGGPALAPVRPAQATPEAPPAGKPQTLIWAPGTAGAASTAPGARSAGQAEPAAGRTPPPYSGSGAGTLVGMPPPAVQAQPVPLPGREPTPGLQPVPLPGREPTPGLQPVPLPGGEPGPGLEQPVPLPGAGSAQPVALPGPASAPPTPSPLPPPSPPPDAGPRTMIWQPPAPSPPPTTPPPPGAGPQTMVWQPPAPSPPSTTPPPPGAGPQTMVWQPPAPSPPATTPPPPGAGPRTMVWQPPPRSPPPPGAGPRTMVWQPPPETAERVGLPSPQGAQLARDAGSTEEQLAPPVELLELPPESPGTASHPGLDQLPWADSFPAAPEPPAAPLPSGGPPAPAAHPFAVADILTPGPGFDVDLELNAPQPSPGASPFLAAEGFDVPAPPEELGPETHEDSSSAFSPAGGNLSDWGLDDAPAETAGRGWSLDDSESVEIPSSGGDVLSLLETTPAPPLAAPKVKKSAKSAAAEAGSDADRLMDGAREFFALGDFSGSLELVQKALKLEPRHAEALSYLQRNQGTLEQMYESKIGSITRTPRVVLKPDEIVWLNLDHRAGFVLAQIDGSVTFDDIFSLSGMTRLDTAKILAELLEQGVIAP